MHSSTWCHHDHTVVVRLDGGEMFTIESAFSLSDMLVREVRVTRHENETSRLSVRVEGHLLTKAGTPGKPMSRPHVGVHLLPAAIKAHIMVKFEEFVCGVAV